MATHSSILAWKILWTEESGGLQSIGHKESDTTEQLSTAQHVYKLWRQKWQPTPVFLTGKVPWTEKPGKLQSMGWRRVRHD